ncbi:MAG: asparagine synthetase B [Gammaproteobacteria bacterium]
MCGFTGILFNSTSSQDQYQPGMAGFRRCADRIAHRGDTDHQEFIKDALWLSHYRLAFQDIAAGVQPMLSHDNKHVIVFNGEIYNHLELRNNISKKTGHQFKTRSDTETILEGWKAFGVGFFPSLEGEYAFVINAVDGSELIAHRDYFGVKPLFFYLDKINTRVFENYSTEYKFETSRLEFSSEIKGLTSKKQWQQTGLLRQFVGLYESICTPFENIINLPAGATLTLRKHNALFQCCLKTNTNPIRHYSNVQSRQSNNTNENDFVAAFQASVSSRLLSDVELGVYLSGGVDSKVVAYELSRHRNNKNPIKSFTLGFEHEGYDETEEALRFSRHLGFKPHVLKIDNSALNYSYPLAVQNSELVQPFTNGAAKWWLSLFTRQYVKGVLTGDGADELLCGYPSYRYVSWWKHCMRIRGKANSAADVDTLLKNKPFGQYQRDSLYSNKYSAHTKNPWLSGSSAAGNGDDFIDSIRVLGVAHPLYGQIKTITSALLGEDEAEVWLQSQASSVASWFSAGLSHLEHELCNPDHSLLLWQNYFAKTHLPTLILNWVGDRMEMANTLEGRTPFLSKQLRDLIIEQPDKNLISGLYDKALLRRSYSTLISAHYANTPKKQFNAPFIHSPEIDAMYNTPSIFETTGICDNAKYQSLNSNINSNSLSNENQYTRTHLQATLQTAVSMSILNESIVKEKEISRDSDFEKNYLQNSGPVK